MRIRLALCFIVYGCSNANKPNLTLTLTDKIIKINHVKGRLGEPCVTTCADINYQLTNHSNENYILYSFNRFFELGELKDSTYCDGYGAAETHLFVYKTNNEQIPSAAFLPDSIVWKPINLSERLNKSRLWFRNSKQIILDNQSILFSRNVDFKEFDLVPGTYSIKILYYQQNVSNYVSNNEVIEDENRFDAVMFKGCLWSNAIKLIVE